MTGTGRTTQAFRALMALAFCGGYSRTASDMPDSPAQSRGRRIARTAEPTRVIVGAQHVGDVPQEQLVYSNTLGQEALQFEAGIVGDDILMTGSPGCLLSRYRFLVTGDANGGGNEPFSVTFALHPDCPRINPSAIPGTAGTAEFPDAGLYLVEFVVPQGVDIPLPQSFWIGVSFSRPFAGWIGGYPAEVGFSRNRYADPFIGGCSALFGANFPEAPHASFHAEVFVREPCQLRFAAYRSTFPERPGRRLAPGEAVADDVQLTVDDCQLVAYELGVRAAAALPDLAETGLFNVALHVDGSGVPASMIEGSETSFSAFGPFLQIVRKEFDPPIPLPRDVWIRAELMEGAGLVGLVIPPTTIGETRSTIARRSEDNWVLELVEQAPGGGVGLGFYATLFCDGEAPSGACCDPYLPAKTGDAFCRDIAEINCPYPPRGSSLLPAWKIAASCDSTPFTPPCGSFACCRAEGTCQDIPRRECFRNGVSWREGVYCEDSSGGCEFVCVPSFEECTLPHKSIGCRDPFCCRAVCAADDFCCEFEWDTFCVLAVADLCGIPPANDECAPSEERAGATMVKVGNAGQSDHRTATESNADPGFCCHAEAPGARGVGTVWYKFDATAASVELRSCDSNAPASDSLIQVFSVRPHDLDEPPCDHLEPIACNDDFDNCSSGDRNSRLCLTGLTLGETYYVMVAAKNDQTRGNYRLRIESGCDIDPPDVCPCPVGFAAWVNPPDGVVDARSPRNNETGGISAFSTFAPQGSDRLECWFFCAEGGNDADPELQSISVNSNGTTRLLLNEPLDPGSVATLSYVDGLGNTTQAAYFVHPGNVNADLVSDANDVMRLVALLDGPDSPVWELFSVDIDRSGQLTPLDVWEEMNVLLGAELPQAWNATQLPVLESCP